MVRFFEAVLDDEMEVVALIEDFALDIGMNRLEPADLLVLLGDQLLIHGRDLDVQLVVGQIEIGCEVLGGLPVVIELDREAIGFVVPRNSIEVKEERELALAVVGKFDFVRRGAVCTQVAPASMAPARSALPGNN